MKTSFLFACLLDAAVAVGVACSAADRLPLPKLTPEVEQRLTSWLDEHRASPEDYVLSKFQDHDIVILGESHRLRHDPVLVQTLIPLLHRNGVHVVGMEFARAAEQADIDRLVTAPSYDEQLAREIIWKQWPWWGYQEYIDIFRAAWQENHDHPEITPPFRVVGLNARMDWSHVWSEADRKNREVMKQVLPDGDSDSVMAETARREIIAPGVKALIYCGINHAYTRFQQPIVESGRLVNRVTDRLGNRIFAQIGDRAFLICLHAPWPARGGYDQPSVYPAAGVIDALMAKKPERVGFDIKGSPFGELTDTTSFWSYAAPEFRLDMFCDGWIYQKPLAQYETVTIAPNWFTEANRAEAIAQISNPDPRVKNRDRSVADLTEALQSTVNLKREFARFR